MQHGRIRVTTGLGVSRKGEITMSALVICAIAFMGFICWISYKAKKQLLSQGKMIEREGGFHKKIHQFTTTAEFDQICSRLKSIESNFASAKIGYSIHSERKSIFFKNSKFQWEAEFVFHERADDKNQYGFCFTQWTNKNGIPVNIYSMNILLTAIEKAILSLDSNAKVVSLDRQLTSKFKFF